MTRRGWGGRKAQRLSAYVCHRDGYRCHVAGCRRRATTADHIIRRDQGGSDHPDNLRAACLHHNSSDGARYGNAKRAGYPPERM